MARAKQKRNPMELLIMGANPGKRARKNPFDGFSMEEKLKLGRAGIKWREIKTEADANRARRALREFDKIRTRFNPTAEVGATSQTFTPIGVADGAEDPAIVAEIYKGFHAKEIDKVYMATDPHIPTGNYAWLGVLYSLHIKPPVGAPDRFVKNQMFPTAPSVITAADRQTIYFSDPIILNDAQLSSYGAKPGENMVKLGEVREIRYLAKKWHSYLKDNDPEAYGNVVNYKHRFGEEDGIRPVAFYDRRMQRVLLHGGNYVVKDEGIVN